MSKLNYKNPFALVRIKIFTFRDLWLFLVGIVIVSMTSGSIGSFMIGVTEEDFFIGGAENILIVGEPGITTPLTGRVPEYLKHDIERITGVEAISPETLGFAVAQNLNDKAVIVRGITANFSKLTPLSLIDGAWFDPSLGETEETHTNGAVVGYLLAEELGISCGEEIQLASTITNVVLTVKITGLIRSDTPTDEEILVSLSTGKYMIGKGTDFVSYHRVMIDTVIITKESLFNILNRQFVVKFLLSSNDPEYSSSLFEIPVTVYTPYGAYIDTKFAGIDNTTEFQLPFGTYEFVAIPLGAKNTPPLSIFMNQNYSKPFEIIVGKLFHDIQFNVTYNMQSANNASVLIEDKFTKITSYSLTTNSTGLTQLESIQEGFYEVTTSYNGFNITTIIRINTSTMINVSLESSISLIILDSIENQEINGGTVTNLNTGVQITDYQSGTPVYLDPGTYHFQFEYNNFARDFYSSVYGKKNETLVLGLAKLRVITSGKNDAPLSMTNVTITRYNKSTFSALTNINGYCDFELEIGHTYNLTTFLFENATEIFYIFDFVNSFELWLKFLTSYQLNIYVHNGTIENNSLNLIENCTVSIFRNTTLISSSITNSSGIVTFSVSKTGLYKIVFEKEGFIREDLVHIYDESQNYSVTLGKAYLLVSTISTGRIPIKNVEVSLLNNESIVKNGLTNSSGLIEFIIPLGQYTISISKYNFSSVDAAGFYLSNRYFLEKVIEEVTDLNITLVNQFSQRMSQANLILIHEHYQTEYRGFTDVNGGICFYGIPWGNYSVVINYYYELFPRILISLTAKQENLRIQVETLNPILNIDVESFKINSQFSVVLSSNYISGFIQNTLTIILTTFTSLIIIIAALSLLSVASVISHPIVSVDNSLSTFSHLGATRQQVIISIVISLSLLGMFASIIGSFLGMWVMTIIPMLKNTNIGGIIIRPKFDLWLLFTIAISNTSVVIIKASQKTNSLYKFY